ncbi:MAG: prolipoprotein diacylglyceryl transferase [Acidimicrobiia bacterium]|nr:prolipoprotein diacylglyceryl transferase [Acidimicrobiia bacterium]
MLAAIPYTTFPEIDLGPITLKTFGLMFALGVVLGVGTVVRWGERYGVPGDEVVSLGTKMVLAGVIGSRVTWVVTHLDSVDSPLDVIAIWKGGLQYSGGFVAALLIGWPTFRHWTILTKARMLDAACLGLTVGIVLGRVGCYSVGEHFGGTTSFFLATQLDGGTTREPAVIGEVFHNTALYEGLHLPVLALLMWWLMRRGVTPGTAAGIFGIWYAAGRFGTDFLRSYDETVAGLTGAQWTCLVVVLPMALYLLLRVRPRMAARVQGEDDPGGGVSSSAAGSSAGTA